MKAMDRIVSSRRYIQLVVLVSLFIGMAGANSSDTLLIHDVPFFHNDDGLGLLQDCKLMKARADGTLTDVPNPVAGRSVGCLSSLKSVAHVLYSLQTTENSSASCLPSAELDWLELLEHVVLYMESQPEESLSEKPYGEWIKDSLYEKYPCK